MFQNSELSIIILVRELSTVEISSQVNVTYRAHKHNMRESHGNHKKSERDEYSNNKTLVHEKLAPNVMCMLIAANVLCRYTLQLVFVACSFFPLNSFMSTAASTTVETTKMKWKTKDEATEARSVGDAHWVMKFELDMWLEREMAKCEHKMIHNYPTTVMCSFVRKFPRLSVNDLVHKRAIYYSTSGKQWNVGMCESFILNSFNLKLQ